MAQIIVTHVSSGSGSTWKNSPPKLTISTCPKKMMAAIIRKLELNKPQYRELAAYGQMGRTSLGVKWEETDKADELRKAAGC